MFALEEGESQQGAAARYSVALNREFTCSLAKLSLKKDNIVFIFDEARALSESKFVLARRALTHFPRNNSFRTPVTLMADTAAKFSNLSLSNNQDPSLRATQMAQGRFPPFYLLSNVDIWVSPDGGPRTIKDMVNPKFYCQYGRPQWGALASQFEVNGFGIGKLMNLARAKVLGGLEVVKESDLATLLKRSALAVLGIRACIDLVPQCQLSQDLVAQHMRTLYHISASRDAVVTGYFSEPVLVLAAGQLTNGMPSTNDCSGWEVLLQMLVQSLRNGQVAAGFRGELVARILLLMAWDRCCLHGVRGSSFTTEAFLKAVPLILFLRSLLHGNIDKELESTFQNSSVRCTHFVKIDYVPNAVQLLELFKRGAAVVIKENQAGTDLIIPIVFCKDDTTVVTPEMVSCVMVQVKNRRDGDPGYPETATTFQTPKATGILIGQNLPYLSLYMSLGEKLGPDNAYILAPKSHSYALRSGTSSDSNLQQCLAVFTLSPKAYAGLNSNLVRLLNLINQSWVDPVILHQGKELDLVVNMVPCQHLRGSGTSDFQPFRGRCGRRRDIGRSGQLGCKRSAAAASLAVEDEGGDYEEEDRYYNDYEDEALDEGEPENEGGVEDEDEGEMLSAAAGDGDGGYPGEGRDSGRRSGPRRPSSPSRARTETELAEAVAVAADQEGHRRRCGDSGRRSGPRRPCKTETELAHPAAAKKRVREATVPKSGAGTAARKLRRSDASAPAFSTRFALAASQRHGQGT